MLSAYFAVAGVFAFWPLVLIVAPILIWLERRRHNAQLQGPGGSLPGPAASDS